MATHNLKAQMAKDISVFFNPDEFGEVILVDGLAMVGLWDQDMVTALKSLGANAALGFGLESVDVNTAERLLYLSPPEGWPEPVPGQELDIEGVYWMVTKVTPEHGCLRLNLQRHEA